MRILASVDESDIGSIKAGQPVEFTVQAYPNEVFAGTVQQVRLQSKTQDNVVNYTAVVSVKNATGKLLPGMTATVQFLTGVARNVLLVPNGALRLRPTPAMLAQVRDAGGAGDARDPRAALLWALDDNGTLAPLRVRTGLTDGRYTQVEGAALAAGTKVVLGVLDPGSAGDASGNPFESPRPAAPQAEQGAGG
jgi:HlyD family secretion protein